MPSELALDAAWIAGFVLAMIRIAAFAIASPLLGRGVPAPARLAFTVAVSLAATERVVGIIELGDLVSAAVVNVAIGAGLGFVTGIILHLFSSAGATIDLVSGLAVSSVFDPMQGDQGGVFARMFHFTAITLFVTAGGLTLLVTGLVGSIRLLPLGAGISADPQLGAHVIDLFGQMVRSAVELALPVIGVMFLVEMALGIASRFAPTANVFLLGLPAKLLTSITVVGSSWVLFPDAMIMVEDTVANSFETVVAGLSVTA